MAPAPTQQAARNSFWRNFFMKCTAWTDQSKEISSVCFKGMRIECFLLQNFGLT
jgi:hypothetical protein